MSKAPVCCGINRPADAMGHILENPPWFGVSDVRGLGESFHKKESGQPPKRADRFR